MPDPDLSDAFEQLRLLYDEAWERYKARCLWNVRRSRMPDAADVSTVTYQLRSYGDMDARRLATRIEFAAAEAIGYEREPKTLHEILTAWQAGKFGHRKALELTGIDTLDELYEAMALSGVAIRTHLNADEEAMAKIVAELIKGQARRTNG